MSKTNLLSAQFSLSSLICFSDKALALFVRIVSTDWDDFDFLHRVVDPLRKSAHDLLVSKRIR